MMRSWMRFIEEVPTAAIRFPSFHMAIARRYQDLDENDFREQIANIRPLRKGISIIGWVVRGSTGRTWEAALEELDSTLVRMEKAAGHRPFG